MAPLPAHRVLPSRPFSVTGTDFAGPFNYKSTSLRSTKILKGYLAVFVCFATKAVHLEFVSDLSTHAFLAALHRFISRRGLPTDLYSDNGRNFVGAAHHLRSVYQFLSASSQELTAEAAKLAFTWHFTPPYAPHFGGLWESVVKSAKTLMKRIIGDDPLTLEEYNTLFCRIEAVLNSRPLTDLSPDPIESAQVLTPGHFLIGSSLMSLPTPSAHLDVPAPQRWKHLHQMTQNFWNRWSKEYLHQLAVRTKWTRSCRNLAVGDLVIIKDVATSPLQWPIGIVSEIHSGTDNVVRVVKIRTNSGICLRSVKRLIPLVAYSTESTD